MRNAAKVSALFIVVLFVTMILPQTIVAEVEEEPKTLPYWASEGNDVGKKDVLGSLNEEDLRIVTHGVQRMVITSDGNIGIGIADPLYRLDVNGDVRISGELLIDSGSGPSLEVTDTGVGIGTSDPQEALDVVGNMHTSGIVITSGIASNSPMIFWAPYPTERARIDDVTGNFGIGTTNPGAKLDVELPYGPYGSVGGAATIGHYHNSATGDYAIAMGLWTEANQIASTAMGRDTTASGLASTAMGSDTEAIGPRSTAMGADTKAIGHDSTAMGSQTIADGPQSTAMGYGTTAGGQFSTAMGIGTTASGTASTAMGRDITAEGDYSFGIGLANDLTPPVITQDNTMAIMGGNVGIGTVTPNNRLSVIGNANFMGAMAIGTWNPLSRLTVYEYRESTTQTHLTQSIYRAGINIETDYTADAYTPGIFWSTQNNNPTKPKAGIYLKETGSGTNMYFGTSNWYSAGITNDAMVIDPDGNVGIGTVNPSYKVDVRNDAGGPQIVARGAGGIGTDHAIGFIYSSGTDWVGKVGHLGSLTGEWSLDLWTDENAPITFWNAGTEKMRIESDGNVGIGTASPNNRLSVSGDADFTGKVGIGTSSPGAKLDVEVSGTPGSVGGAATIGHYRNLANGDYAIAMGYDTTASNSVSTAIGVYTTASGSFSIAMGYETTASAKSSTAMGKSIIADGDYSFGIGLDYDSTPPVITQDNTMAIMGGKIGIGTVRPNNILSVSGDADFTGKVGIGTSSPGAKLDVSLPDGPVGTLGGAATIGHWRNSATGDYAIATGVFTTASGRVSTSMGFATTASEFVSTAMGYYTTASGIKSTAMGSSIIADGDYSFGIGLRYDSSPPIITQSNTMAIMGGKVGIGTVNPSAKLEVEVSGTPGSVGGAATIGHSSNSASGDYAIALGYGTDAIEDVSIAMGVISTASGWGSTAMGYDTTAFGHSSTAMGRYTNASGDSSTAMGFDSDAYGDYSTSMGYKTNASGSYSTSMGYNTNASGLSSTAMGSTISAEGDYSFGIGLDYSDPTWTITEDNTMAIMGGNVGIGTVSPSTKLHVDGVITASGGNSDEWNAAYGWGDHSSQGYLVSESDPVFGASAASEIMSGDITNWNTAYGWGDHTLAGYDTTSDSWTGTGDVYTTSGNVGIGTSAPNEQLTVEGALSLDEITAPSATSGYGKLYVKSTDSKLYYQDDSGSEYDLTASSSGGIGGSGTANYISKFTGPASLGNSAIYETGGNIGIGTTNPQAKLDIHVTSGGAATIGHFSNAASGSFAVAFGQSTHAGGDSSTAMGIETIALGEVSTAMGWGTRAEGEASVAMGILTTASGWWSFAMGDSSTASGSASTAMGSATTASGWGTTAMGNTIIVEGDYSFGIGLDNKHTPWAITQDNTMAIMGGNVGIGTVSPQRDLHVSDTMRLEPRTTAPSSPGEGDIYYDSTLHKLMVYDGTSWQACW
jgi:hypothetical protein